MSSPVLSVVMLVYNGEKYLREAIDSVLHQTFSDFELLVINDGSNDNSIQIIDSYTDARIRVISHPVNRGIPYCRNLGIENAKGRFLTWTDCDDVNILTRFEEQVKFLNGNPTISACGTSLIRFGGRKLTYFRPSTKPELVKATLLFRSSMPNATVMLRLSKIISHGLMYDVNLPIAEDYDFILRCSKFMTLTNIRKILYKYRDSETSIMRAFGEDDRKSFEVHKVVYARALANIKIVPTERELAVHQLIGSNKGLESISDLVCCFEWMLQIQQANGTTAFYQPKALDEVLAAQFYFVCLKASRFGIAVFKYYFTKSVNSFGFASIAKAMKLLLYCVAKVR